MALTLEGKPWYWGLALGLIIGLAAVATVHYMLVVDMNKQIAEADAQIAELDTKIEQGRAAEKKLPQFRAEVARLEAELEKLRRILPSTRNTEEIIQKIKALVDQGDFVLKRLTFPKLNAAKGSDPYAEWPISVQVDGRYHNLAILFNRLGNFSRIMNVENIVITALPLQAERTIAAEFVAKTFVYSEPSEEAPAEGENAPAKPGGDKKKGEGLE